MPQSISLYEQERESVSGDRRRITETSASSNLHKIMKNNLSNIKGG